MLYAEYRAEHFQWESLVMLRKLGMVIVVVFLGYINMSIQLMAALGLVTVLGESQHGSGEGCRSVYTLARLHAELLAKHHLRLTLLLFLTHTLQASSTSSRIPTASSA